MKKETFNNENVNFNEFNNNHQQNSRINNNNNNHNHNQYILSNNSNPYGNSISSMKSPMGNLGKFF